jgi:hypothetical protein
MPKSLSVNIISDDLPIVNQACNIVDARAFLGVLTLEKEG